MNNIDLKKIADLFNARPERERQLALLGLLSLIIAGWIYLFFLPANNEIGVVTMPIDITKQALQKATTEYELLQTTELNPPTAALMKKKAELVAKLAQLNADPAYARKLIAPAERMRSILNIILITEPGLTLDQLEDKAAENKLRLQFHGDYFAVMDFFKRLESLPWYVFYEDFNYKVDLYPTANVRLTINTPPP